MRRLLIVFACVAVLASFLSAQDRSGLEAILGFEATANGDCPGGWSCASGGAVAVDRGVVHSGKASVRIQRDEAQAQPFTTITKSLNIDFGGSTVELRGFIRTEDVKDFSGFWLREDSAGGSQGFVSMQGKQPVSGTTPWTEYSISLPLSVDARTLVFGFLLTGPGKAWADDLQLLIDGKPVWDAPKRDIPKTVLDSDQEFDRGSKIALTSLSTLQMENLVTLGKVWGFLKYHHPLVTSGTHHFDYDLFRAMPAVLEAADRTAAQAAIVKWVDGLGEVKDCESCAALDEKDLHLRPRLGWISDESLLGAELSNRLRRIYQNRTGGTQFYVSKTQGVGNPVFDHELPYNNVALDAGLRILALYRFWNIVEYWYPNRDLVGDGWDGALGEFLPRIGLAKNRDEYQREMMALIARIGDTHANLWSSIQVRPPVGACQVAVNVRFVGNRAVVAGYLNPELGKATGLMPGDVIESLDGTETASLVKGWTPYYAASNEPTRLRDIGRSMLRGDCAKPAALRVRRGGKQLEVSAARVAQKDLDTKAGATHDLPGDTFRRLSHEVAYLKLSSVKIADAAHYVDSAAGTKGLIIDIRNYPSEFMVFPLGQLLVDKPTPFVRFTSDDLRNPGATHWAAVVSLTPQQPHYAGKVVILVDEISQSQAEYTAMAFRSAPGAVVIGSTTAGADGNVSQIPLPGGLSTMISGLGVFYPDKRPTQRIGILPDEVVKPTIAGIAAGRDEVLEAAIRRILGKDTPQAVVEKLAAGH